MRRVYPPEKNGHGVVGCADALEPAFMQLLDRAEQAGWGHDEVLTAICVLTWRLAEPEATRAATAA